MPSSGEQEVGVSQQVPAPSTTATLKQVEDSSFGLYAPMAPDVDYQNAFAGSSQATITNADPSQNMMQSQQHSEEGSSSTGLQLDDERQRLLMRLQNEYCQLAARNPYVNQQLMMNQGSQHPLAGRDAFVSGAPATQMSANMDPEMLFATSSGPGLRCPPPQFSGLLPPHSDMIFPGGGLAPVEAYQSYSMNAVNSAGNKPKAITNSQRAKDSSKKDPEMPVRPLSAYNFFFRDERERILRDGEDAVTSEETIGNSKERDKRLLEKKKRLLEEHLNRDRTQRRPHRKTHGKIGFASLSKLIGRRWRELPEGKKKIYRDIASMDMDRYQRDVAEYHNDRLYRKQNKT